MRTTMESTRLKLLGIIVKKGDCFGVEEIRGCNECPLDKFCDQGKTWTRQGCKLEEAEKLLKKVRKREYEASPDYFIDNVIEEAKQ